MDLRIAQRVVGLLLMGFGLSLMIPLAVAVIYQDGTAEAFRVAALSVLWVGLLLWFPTRGHRTEMRLRDGYLVALSFWLVLSLAGTVPYLFLLEGISFTDALFESLSGFTTTGATVLIDVHRMPESLILYRHMTQWLGGMGVLVLAIAIMPILGIGGFSLYRAETSGVVKDTQIGLRMIESVQALWWVYIGLTAACALAYQQVGLPGLEAIGMAMSTVSTGGFTEHSNVAHHADAGVEWVAIVFMLLGGISYALHYTVLRRRRPWAYLTDPETRLYLKIILGVTALCVVFLLAHAEYATFGEALRVSLFQTISTISTTGLTTAEFSLWPVFLPALLIFLSMIGGCGGSTAGGMKVLRVYLIGKQLRWEVLSLVHPSAMPVVRAGGRKIENSVVRAVWGFFAVYAVIYGLLMVLMLAAGLDEVSAFSAVAATLNNLGPGLGSVADSFAAVSDFGKWVAMLAMLIGRVEIFIILVLLSPEFWRH